MYLFSSSDEKDDSDELRAARKAVLNFMYENVVGPIPMGGGATKIDATLVLLVSALFVV